MKRPKKPKGPKEIKYDLIPEDGQQGEPMYDLLGELVAAHHDELIDARIALAFTTSWKADADGRLTLGKCKKATDLDRELAPYDFVIILNREFWSNLRVTERQRRALLDHELCHATVKYGDDGEPERDTRDRLVYRVRKHDIEEFVSIVSRYGCYKRDLEYFASALQRGPELFERPASPATPVPEAPPASATDAAEAFVAATPPGTSLTMSVHADDGSVIGTPVHITPEDSERARLRIATRTPTH